MPDSSPVQPSPEEAEQLLAHARRVSTSAVAGVSWPYITALVGLGAATSLGTLAMNLTSGTTYFVSTIAMLVWVALIIGGFIVFGRGSSKLGFQKRWGRYVTAWAFSYGIAIVFATSELKGNVFLAILASLLIAAVTVTSAIKEARS
ncbi:hypothetical protein [Subtercola sp. RTI3]|uniref:hypothetical protein n=1 Tax=Subtercola sp. RTI3 TaxID=3048639 RepID=UPI002B23CD34|nr:hypothetical protein [Subtercola sp. RTI3]MEA9987244.1 hypothetical protein [Subtercola sp. RTI3]